MEMKIQILNKLSDIGRVNGVERVDLQCNKAFEAESFEQCHLSKLDCMN